MLSIERLQLAVSTIKAQNRRLRKLVEQKQHINPYKETASLPEDEQEAKGGHATFACPELDAVLATTEFEVEQLMLAYRL